MTMDIGCRLSRDIGSGFGIGGGEQERALLEALLDIEGDYRNGVAVASLTWFAFAEAVGVIECSSNAERPVFGVAKAGLHLQELAVLLTYQAAGRGLDRLPGEFG